MSEQKLEKAMNLLERAVGYEAIPPEREWWKDYFALTGEHMILIEDGGWITAAEYRQIEDGEKPDILDEYLPKPKEGVASARGSGPNSVVNEVARERERQDAQWGGSAHDDQHDGDTWLDLISKQLHCSTLEGEDFRERMVKIAALAVAAIESTDRRAAR